jgi:hypothetical protein
MKEFMANCWRGIRYALSRAPQFQYASWQFVGYTSANGTKMPRAWCKRRKSYGDAKHVWEIAFRFRNRLHAIVVWW